MAHNAAAVAPARPRKTLTLKSTAKPDEVTPPEPQGAQPIPTAEASKPKAAKTARRGRNVGAQLLMPGEIKPNAGTVFGVVVGLVAELGTVTRAGLIDAMGHAAFANPKARPTDAGWCQGYVAGALRDGFLALVPATPDAATEAEN